MHLLSFLTGSKNIKRQSKTNHLNYPSPTFIEHKELQVMPKLKRQDILEGMIVDDKRGLTLVDKNIMKKFINKGFLCSKVMLNLSYVTFHNFRPL